MATGVRQQGTSTWYINSVHQRGASTRCINSVHQLCASTRCINSVHQLGASTLCINLVHQHGVCPVPQEDMCHKKTRLLVPQEDMSSCVARRHVFLCHKKRSISETSKIKKLSLFDNLIWDHFETPQFKERPLLYHVFPDPHISLFYHFGELRP